MEELKEFLIEFAQRTDRNFQKIQEKFTEVDQRFDQMENSFNEKIGDLKDKVDSLEAKVDSLEVKVNSLEAKVDSLEVKVNSLETKVNGLTTKVEQHDQEIKELFAQQFKFEHEYATKIDVIFDSVSLELDKNLEKSEKIRKLDHRMDRAETNIFGHEKRISSLEMKK